MAARPLGTPVRSSGLAGGALEMAARMFGTSANFRPRGLYIGDGGQDARHFRQDQASRSPPWRWRSGRPA
eukprot:11085381-Heterocapsa_arctica.AAC.1